MESIIPFGVCAKRISYEVEEGKISKVEFEGGCPGNLIGISKIVVGMPVEEVIGTFKGITCGRKPTSCPDQLAQALERTLKN